MSSANLAVLTFTCERNPPQAAVTFDADCEQKSSRYMGSSLMHNVSEW